MLRANDGGGDSGLIRWRRGDMFASSDIIVIGRSYELEARSYSCLGVVIAMWFLAIGYFASGEFLKPFPFGDDYQYDIQTKGMPGDMDWNKPLYEIIIPPGKGCCGDHFDKIGKEYVAGFDKSVKEKKSISVGLPDGSRLFLNAELTESDQNYLSKLFWEQRWRRYSSKISPWLGLFIGPPIGVLIFGFAVSWVRRGFIRRA